MCNCIHHFESRKDRNGKQSLPVIRDEWKVPANEDSQGDDEDKSAEEVTNDRKRISPLSRCGDASDAALCADGHTNNNEQNDIHADVGEQGNLFPVTPMEVIAAKRIASPIIAGVMTAGCVMVFMVQFPFSHMIVLIK